MSSWGENIGQRSLSDLGECVRQEGHNTAESLTGMFSSQVGLSLQQNDMQNLKILF